MRNFVIIYSGRTGSSPIVNILARQPGVRVPVFENLDHRFVGPERARDIAPILDAVFATGRLEGAELPEHLPRFPEDATPESTGFKWRPYGDWPRVCEVFRRHDVMLFVLSRRDVVELASSLYITSVGNSLQDEVAISKHPQFGLALEGRAATERAAIEKLQTLRLPVRPRPLYRIMRQQARVRGELAERAAEAHRAGVPVRSIYYEDFVADNAGFIRGLLGELGWPAGAATLDTTTSFEKVMKVPAKSRLRHLGAWLWLPPLRHRMLQYAAAGRELEAIAASSRAGRPLSRRARPARAIPVRG